MRELEEIRWHARGGQGAVTASKLLAEMALTRNMYFQAFPEYGPERMGAPIQCFNRLSARPISIYTSVSDPNVVVVVDPTLIGVVDVTEGLTPDGVVLVNTPATPQEVASQLGLSSDRVYTVDATAISMTTLGRAMPNIPMLGALVKILDLMPLDEALAYVRESFGKRFSAKVTEGNLAALERAYKEVKSSEMGCA